MKQCEAFMADYVKDQLQSRLLADVEKMTKFAASRCAVFLSHQILFGQIAVQMSKFSGRVSVVAVYSSQSFI